VRFKPLQQVYDDISRFISAGVHQVKFIDRTFNCDRSRCHAIWRFLIDAASRGAKTSYHFELSAELIDSESLEILSRVPAGMFQFEIGFQSTHQPTLEAINRRQRQDLMYDNIRKLQALRRQHLHLDLIVGLPEEGWQESATSLDRVAALRPDRLQLGILKLLPGSSLRETAAARGDLFSAEPPYEVLKSNRLSHKEILRLQQIADLVDRFRNAGRFSYTLKFMESQVDSAFSLFEQMAEFWDVNSWWQPTKEASHYRRLAEFGVSLGFPSEMLNTALALDFCLWHRYDDLPEPIDEAVHKDKERKRLLRKHFSADEISALFPEAACDLSKDAEHFARFELFVYNPNSLLAGKLAISKENEWQLFFAWQDAYKIMRAARRSVLI